MINVPNILSNPFDQNYKLKDYEIYSLKECLELIELKKYSYSLFALWSTVIMNLQRRIEYFGIKNFLEIIEKKDQYNTMGNTLKDRWLNINEYKILEYSFKINIINHITLNLLITLYWMKSNTNEDENKNLDENEIYSLVYLIEKNLFLSEFKEDKRGKDPMLFGTNLKFRRKEDIEKEPLNELPNTHQNLMMRSGVQIFEEQNKQNNSNDNIIDKYC
jgi:hypothetical protein